MDDLTRCISPGTGILAPLTIVIFVVIKRIYVKSIVVVMRKRPPGDVLRHLTLALMDLR